MSISVQGTVYVERPENFSPKIEVSGCFLHSDENILLLHRQNKTSQGNLWGLPAGKVEKGETPLQAVIRETFEETECDISQKNIAFVTTLYIKYPNKDFVFHLYTCTVEEYPRIVLNYAEHKGFTWVTPEEALRMELMLDEDTCIKLVYADTLCVHA